ncbi:NUDIX domain-containing protein [bacterium]|jgi:ADP-ribose pyrophosphatase YjhB (NUDIX family)|nr:NUDIX domain-containing protein [bacterium]
MNTIVKARAIIIKDHKIFLVKDTRCNMFILPGGTQEEGETVEETFYREIIEEL